MNQQTRDELRELADSYDDLCGQLASLHPETITPVLFASLMKSQIRLLKEISALCRKLANNGRNDSRRNHSGDASAS